MFSSFMLNSWIVGTIIAGVAGCAGFFVVLRGASFSAHALPLGTFPGAAAASLLGVDPFWGLIVFSGLGVLGISQFSRFARRDVATALSLITLLGLGTLFLSLSRAYSAQVYALLFGEALGVSAAEIAPVAIGGALCVIATGLLYRPLLLSSVAPELAAARGVSASRMELCFLAILALATALALPVVGALLVFSLMIGPAAAARFLTNRPLPAALLCVALAFATVWAALALAYLSNWPIGFFVGAISALCYAAGRVWKGVSAGRAQAA